MGLHNFRFMEVDICLIFGLVVRKMGYTICLAINTDVNKGSTYALLVGFPLAFSFRVLFMLLHCSMCRWFLWGLENEYVEWVACKYANSKIGNTIKLIVLDFDFALQRLTYTGTVRRTDFSSVASPLWLKVSGLSIVSCACCISMNTIKFLYI